MNLRLMMDKLGRFNGSKLKYYQADTLNKKKRKSKYLHGIKKINASFYLGVYELKYLT